MYSWINLSNVTSSSTVDVRVANNRAYLMHACSCTVFVDQEEAQVLAIVYGPK